MPSATETAIAALVAALTARANLPSPPFPVPTRNQTLPEHFAQFGAVKVYFTVFDGDGGVFQETLGNPDTMADTYEIHHRPKLMWAVMGTDDAAREAAFDAGKVGINAALAADRSLGGAVSWCEIEEVQSEELATDTLAETKGVMVHVRLEFLSSAPI